MDFFEIEGYWKDGRQTFLDYVVSSGYNYDEFGWSDEDIFIAGLSEKELQDLITAGEETGEDFVVLRYVTI